jgi:hypothetical protein
MARRWLNDILIFLQGVPNRQAVNISQIPAVVPRPRGCPDQLITVLLRDDTFKLFAVAANGAVTVLVGLGPEWAPPGAVPIHDHRPGRIPFVADLFAGHLNTLAENQLIACEEETHLKGLFDRWKAQFHELRGAFAAVRDELRTRRVLSYFRNKIIIAPSSRPQRAVARRLALSVNAHDPILGDQGGVFISEFVFDQNAHGERVTIRNGQQITAGGSIQNENGWPVELRTLQPHHTHWKFRFYQDTGNIRRRLRLPVIVRPHETVSIAAQFTAQTSIATVNTLFKFLCVSNGAEFVMGRRVTIHVGDPAVQTLLAPIAPFKRKPRQRAGLREVPTQIVEGVKPPGADDANTQYKGPQMYHVPKDWNETVKVGEAGDILAAERANLSAATLRALYHKLLWTEELQMDKDILNYSIDNARLGQNRSFLTLEVAGLAEKRPSVLKGDSVLVHRPQHVALAAGVLKKYKGYVHEVQRDTVLLKFSPEFHHSYVSGEKVNVEFTYNRMTLRLCHQAVDALTPQLTSHLLPSQAPEGYPLALQPVAVHPVNRTLNEQQLLAVKRIVQRSNVNRNCPYIIYGPPGTGTPCVRNGRWLMSCVGLATFSPRVLSWATSDFSPIILLHSRRSG